MYKEFVKKDDKAVDDLRKLLLNMDSLKALLQLGLVKKKHSVRRNPSLRYKDGSQKN